VSQRGRSATGRGKKCQNRGDGGSKKEGDGQKGSKWVGEHLGVPGKETKPYLGLTWDSPEKRSTLFPVSILETRWGGSFRARPLPKAFNKKLGAKGGKPRSSGRLSDLQRKKKKSVQKRGMG